MVSRLTVKGQVTIPKPLRDSLGLEPGHELEFEECEGTLLVRRRMPVDPLKQLVGLVRERIDIDAYLDETRGPRWRAGLDDGEG
jgi:AbrB family looped-hinge helix DNA binding protein